jgi:hypothetical protein
MTTTLPIVQEEEVSRLARVRDELRLLVHLAQADAGDEWERLERRWHELQRRLPALEEAAEETREELLAGVRLLCEELEKGYRRIRRAL